MSDSKEKQAWFLLHETGLPAALCGKLVRANHGAQNVLLLKTGDFESVAGRGKWTEKFKQISDKRFKETRLSAYEKAQERGFKYLTEDEFEHCLPSLGETQMPFALWVHGKAELLNSEFGALAIVGTRKASPYGISAARQFARGFAARRITVVSGMARGIDSAAHRATIDAGGTTIACLGTGLFNVYPPENRSMQEFDIPENGLVVSEFPLNTRPEPHNFPRRNRLIAGFSLGVVVIEGREDSGSLITARLAAEQGKEVFAVPGAINSEGTCAPHILIKNGAKLVTGIEDVLDEFECFNNRPQVNDSVKQSQYSSANKTMLRTLSFDPVSIDDILEKTKMPLTDAIKTLLELETSGDVEQTPSGAYVLARPLNQFAMRS
ncbi:DNA-processing protein DprA [Elusimicrobiota bacterium]